MEHLRLLTKVGYPQFLVSAYDLANTSPSHQKTMTGLLRRAVSSGSIVLLDSGNYEAFWSGAGTKWSAKRFSRILRRDSFQLAFSFDDPQLRGSMRTLVESLERGALRDQAAARHGTIMPIVHGSKDILPKLAKEIGKRLNPMVLAVPERELGEGLLERAATVAHIRSQLNQLGYYCNLHLLGTGNPLSLLVFALCGADTFDGLEWCQTTVDYDSVRLFHLSQWDLFRHQSGLDFREEPYLSCVLIHNLLFYSQWLDRLRWAIRTGKWLDLLKKHLPKDIVREVRRLAPEPS